MIEWFGDWLALWMIIALLPVIFSGYPAAFSLGGVALIFAGLGLLFGYFDPPYLMAMGDRMFGIMSNGILPAVPVFIFMGTVLERSGLAEDLLQTIGRLFGNVRGGLAVAVVAVGTLLAAATGVVGASVVAMGAISLPVMLQNGYDRRLAGGVIAASGTLGQIIPPSIVLIVLADQLGVSVGALFRAALLPGLLLALLFAVWVLVIARIRPDVAPAIPQAEGNRRVPLREVVATMLPPLLLILIVLGSIFAGVATPTEAGALGSIGAVILAGVRGRLDRTVIGSAGRETASLTVMVMFLLIGATLFTLVFRGLYGDVWIEEMLVGLPGGEVGLLLTANLIVFILGFFIDFFEIAFIVIPLLAPAAATLGIDLVWFGVMISMNLQTSFLTPPFGFSLFYLRGVAPPEVRTTDIYRGAVPFIIIQLIALLMVVVFPGIVG